MEYSNLWYKMDKELENLEFFAKDDLLTQISMIRRGKHYVDDVPPLKALAFDLRKFSLILNSLADKMEELDHEEDQDLSDPCGKG